MDRFIVIPIPTGTRVLRRLKSNMDRFIADAYIEYADNPSV